MGVGTQPARLLQPPVEPAATTRICFRYKTPGRHVALFDVQIVLDDTGLARRIEIRRAAAMVDDLPPLSSGRLSAARLRAAVELLGLIERLIRNCKTQAAPGALVSILHLHRLRRPKGTQPIPKPDAVRKHARSQSATLQNRARTAGTTYGRARVSRKSLAMALSRTTIFLARARIRYPLRRP